MTAAGNYKKKSVKKKIKTSSRFHELRWQRNRRPKRKNNPTWQHRQSSSNNKRKKKPVVENKKLFITPTTAKRKGRRPQRIVAGRFVYEINQIGHTLRIAIAKVLPFLLLAAVIMIVILCAEYRNKQISASHVSRSQHINLQAKACLSPFSQQSQQQHCKQQGTFGIHPPNGRVPTLQHTSSVSADMKYTFVSKKRLEN